jgi:rhodanese-related sulfurtransferase
LRRTATLRWVRGVSDPPRFTLRHLLAEAHSHLTRMTPAQAQAEAVAGAVILDTRQNTDRWSGGVIAGSLHTPRTVLEWVVDPISGYQNPFIEGFDQVLIVMCNEGYSSSLAAYNLQRIGFSNSTDMIGGFAGWCAAGLPIQTAQPHEAGVLDGRWPPEPAAELFQKERS